MKSIVLLGCRYSSYFTNVNIEYVEHWKMELIRKQFRKSGVASNLQKARLPNDRTQEFREITLDSYSDQVTGRGLFLCVFAAYSASVTTVGVCAMAGIIF